MRALAVCESRIIKVLAFEPLGVFFSLSPVGAMAMGVFFGSRFDCWHSLIDRGAGTRL